VAGSSRRRSSSARIRVGGSSYGSRARGVHGLGDLARRVGPDGQRGQVERPASIARLLEVTVVAGVPAEVEALRPEHRPRGPKATALVDGGPAVVVVVRDQDEVDGGQLVERDAGRGVAAHPHEPAEGTAPAGPGRIGHEGHAVELRQHGGVADPGHGRPARLLAERPEIRRRERQRGDPPLRDQPGGAHHQRVQPRPVGRAPVLRVHVLVGAARPLGGIEEPGRHAGKRGLGPRHARPEGGRKAIAGTHDQDDGEKEGGSAGHTSRVSPGSITGPIRADCGPAARASRGSGSRSRGSSTARR
jgi:hypothetical protein